MLFNSLEFLYVFLPITYLVFWRLQTKSQRYRWLTLTGYVFYGFWNYKFCALLAFSTLVSYSAGIGLLRTDTRHRKLFLIVPIVSDLLVLAFFKYVDFGIGTINGVSSWFGWNPGFGPLNILLPVGISFYTFHNISYIVDSYRGVIRPTRNLWEYMCYVSLFSQLVAGPIVRFRQIEADLDQIDQKNRREFLNRGWSFFAVGLIEKVLIADSLATIINPALARYEELSSIDAWLTMLGYSYQLYFDFSGYSDMAVGLGYMFGLRIPQNFDSPYQTLNIRNFWRRWPYVAVWVPSGLRLLSTRRESRAEVEGQQESALDDVLGAVSRIPTCRVPSLRPLLGSIPSELPASGDVHPRGGRMGVVSGRVLHNGWDHSWEDVLVLRRLGHGSRQRELDRSAGSGWRDCALLSERIRA